MHNPLSNERCVDYAWRQLWQRAAPGDDDAHQGISLSYARPDQVDLVGPGIIVVPCGAGWPRLLEQPPDSLDWVPVHEVLPRNANLPFTDPVPVLFWGEGYEEGEMPFAELRDDGKLIFYVDIIAATFFMLSRWEETVVPDRDEHDRFPGTASVAHRQGFLGRPVVDEYALILREWLKVLLPGWEPERRHFSIKLVHDIDQIRRFTNWRSAARTIAGDLFNRRSLMLAWQTCVAAASPRRDPYYERISHLAAISLEFGLGNTTFNLMVEKNGPFGSGYDIASPLIKQCISDLRQQDFEVGLHAGYDTLNDPERLAKEKTAFDAVVGETQYSSSQHFLRVQVPDTWRHWEQVGLAHVTTMVYAEQEGFRCGTCHPFRPFDLAHNRELDLWELPLIVMDTTLVHYKGLSPAEGEARILELAHRCRHVEGTFTLLWHNTSLDASWKPWVNTYHSVVTELAEMAG